MAVVKGSADQKAFDDIVRSFEAQIANVGTHLTIDASARLAYTRAQETRNVVMELVRGRSTPVGQALAKSMKAEGRTLNALIAHQVKVAYGSTMNFAQLSMQQKNAIYAAIVSSAGRSNASVTKAMSRLSYAGRGLILLSLGLSVYNVATSTDIAAAARKEATVTGAGIAGGIAGGALAGLACGPGAPVCVTLGAFVGGAMAAFGVSYAW